MGFRIRKCRGSAKVVLPASGGVSVSNHQNEAGESTVTICSILQDNSKSCQTIMNPDGIMVSSISNMGNTLQVSTTALLQWMQSSNLPNSLKKSHLTSKKSIITLRSHLFRNVHVRYITFLKRFGPTWLYIFF